MSCFGNGDPIGPVLGRIYLQDFCVDSQGDSINIDYTAQHELQLEQVVMHFNSPLTQTDLVSFQKNNVVIPFGIVLIQFDPFAGNVFDWWNVTPFRWRKNDHVWLYFQNLDDIGVSAEIILRIVG